MEKSNIKRVSAEEIQSKNGLLEEVLNDIEMNGVEYIITVDGVDKAVICSYQKYMKVL